MNRIDDETRTELVKKMTDQSFEMKNTLNSLAFDTVEECMPREPQGLRGI